MSTSQRAAVAARAEQLHRARLGPIARRPGDVPALASFAQERLWFVDRLRPGSGAYNITVAIPFAGPLNLRALADALRAVAERHETLRTTFALDRGSLVQVVHPPADVVLPVLDVHALPEPQRAEEIERITGRELEDGFDLSQGPVCRSLVVRETADRHLLLATMHHVCSDGWSVAVLQRELLAAYAALSRGTPPSFAPLPVQYADYAAWQRERLARGDWDGLLEYWTSQMQDAPRRLTLPASRPRPEAATLAGAWRAVRLEPAVVSRLKRVALAHRCTPFMVLLALYAAVVQRFSGQDEIVVGVPVANRGRVELEGLIGFFVNALPIRIAASASDSFLDVLRRVRAAALGAYQHQELPFEKLVVALDVDRDVRINPVFQATFSLQAAPLVQSSSDAEHRADLIRGSIKFDLSLHLRESGGAIVGSLGYATELFDDELGAALAAGFVGAAAIAADRPDAALMDLVPGDAGVVLTAAAAHPAPEASPVFDWPAGLALIESGAALTWADIRDAAETACRELKDAGVRRGTPVVVASSSVSTHLGGVIGTLLAGGAVVAAAPSSGVSPAAGVCVIDGRVRPGPAMPPVADAALFDPHTNARYSAGEVRALLDRVASTLELPAGSLVAIGPLAPAHLSLVGLLAAARGCGLVAAPTAAADALLDHATWEGASTIVVDAGMASAIAERTRLPLQALSFLVVGGPIPAACAGALIARGARGLVLVDGDPVGPWLLAATLEEAARAAVPVTPLLDAALMIRDAGGRPVPQGGVGQVWGRVGRWPEARCVLPRPAVGGARGAVLLLADDRPPAAAPPPDADSALTAALAAIWSDVLGHAAGIDEDFFVIGGHSLAAAQVTARVQDLLRVPMQVQQLFNARTVRQLAAHLGDGPGADALERTAALLLRVAALSDAEVSAELAQIEAA